MTGEPTTAEIMIALERLLSSPYFARSRRAKDFLRFVTKETLAGRAHSISAYSIAIDVFDKPKDFDASNNPLVRVEAIRLRSRLCEYYATLGASDAVRIEMKPGSYVPLFRFAVPQTADVGRAGKRKFPRYLGLSAGLVAAIAIVGALAPWLGDTGGELGSARPALAELRRGPRIFVRQFDAKEPSETATLAFGITEEILTRLGSYRDLEIVVRRGGDDTAGADFVLSGSVSTDDDTIRVSPRLIDARTGVLIWTTAYKERFTSDNVWDAVDSVAGGVVAAVGEPYGPLFDAEVARTIPGTTIDAYHCLLRFVFALQVISEGAHARATACFEQAVATEPESSTSWARLAALYRMEYLHGFNPRRAPPPALDRAEHAALRAIAIDTNNAFGHEELAFLRLLRDDRAGFEDAVARTLALNPSADIRTALGINFVKMGQVERGRELIDAGIADSPRAPPFFFLGYAVDALRMHDYGAAYEWSRRMSTRTWPLSQAFLAATAALAGHPERSGEAVARLRALQPTFAATGRELIARGRLGEEVNKELARGLALAGLPLD